MARLDDLVTSIGEAGRLLADMGACEGAAGNISVGVRGVLDPRDLFPNVERLALPLAVPGLAGSTFLVSGSGCRLRDLLPRPGTTMACVVVGEDGHTGYLYTSPERQFARVTSEFNSHLAVHQQRMVASGSNFHAVVHAHPAHLTYLSHVPAYQDEGVLNQRLLRWEAETVIFLPEGIGWVPFQVPGSTRLLNATSASLQTHQIVIWAKHGVIARSDESIRQATDRIEYAEAAARFEYMDLVAGGPGTGLTDEEIGEVCSAHGIRRAGS